MPRKIRKSGLAGSTARRFNGAEAVMPRKMKTKLFYEPTEEKLQWGRGSDASEDLQSGRHSPPGTGCFNGAEAVMPRKIMSACKTAYQSTELQWGRGSDASEDARWSSIFCVSFLLLQWGRGSDASEDIVTSEVEHPAILCFNGAEAVMPRKISCRCYRHWCSSIASMGPRQ